MSDWWMTPFMFASLDDVELPNQVQFMQYVFRIRHYAMTKAMVAT